MNPLINILERDRIITIELYKDQKTIIREGDSQNLKRSDKSVLCHPTYSIYS